MKESGEGAGKEPPPRPVAIFGAGALARLLRKQLEEAGWQAGAFVVDEAHRQDPLFEKLPLLAWCDFLNDAEYAGFDLLIGVGYRSMRLREEVAARAASSGRQLATFISPAAHVSPSATIGAGCVLFAGCVVEPFAKLGSNNLMWSGGIVCHDTVIGDHNYLSPGVTISGTCRIGSRCFLGTRVTLIDAVHVGDDCQIAAGAVLYEDAAPCGGYAGLPAVRRKEIDPVAGVRILR